MSVSPFSSSISADNSSPPVASPPAESSGFSDPNGFVVGADRRKRRDDQAEVSPDLERRQFGNTYNNLSQEGQELAQAIDRYKMQHRRRYITTDEIILVLKDLGYRKG